MPGGTFFFTLVTAGRAPILCNERARLILRNSILECQRSRPFVLDAMVLLPDHLHSMWTLPAGDTNFSIRWNAIKSAFTRNWLAAGGEERLVSTSRATRGGRGVWQPRFAEHLIRDDEDWTNHVNYFHYNPVKHGLVRCPHEWPHSTFHRWVRGGHYDPNWQCVCNGGENPPPSFDELDRRAIE